MNWYAIYTKPKAEDSTSQLLSNAGIETLSPKIRVKKFVRKKYVSMIEPLFPCYIFALFDCKTHGHMVTYTRGVKYVVGKEKPLVVVREIIDAIKERLEGNVVLPVPVRLKRGDRVIVREGPFKDFYGVFERDLSGRERVMILLEALHCRLEIESEALKKA